MKGTKSTFEVGLLALFLIAGVVSLPNVSLAAASSTSAMGQEDASSAAQGKLNKSQFKDVKASVQDGIATLTGSVSLFEYKQDAAKRVSKAKGVTAVRNEIQVAGPEVSDTELKDKLLEKLTYDRVGYGNVFNAVSLNVQNGVVTLGGTARTDVDKDSALALVSTYPGVKDVIDEIEVDPTSIMDDQTRLAVARAIYRYPALQKYSIDPAKPIRISVQNGHVSLYGVVNSKSDRDLAYMRANGVPGVFSVENHLQVAGQPEEKPTGSAQK